MKRSLVILLLVVSIGMLTAVDSAPSATVGYFKLNIASNSWAPFSLPFSGDSLSVRYLIGDQFADQDMIQDIASGFSTVYYAGFGWFGDLTDLSYGSAYWINRVETNPTTDYFLMGTVNPQPVTINVVGNGWTPFSLNEARNIEIATLPITGVTDQDMIQDIATGLSTVYYDGFGWFGDLTATEPTHAYWYFTTNASSFSWTYTPAARNNVTPTFKVKAKK